MNRAIRTGSEPLDKSFARLRRSHCDDDYFPARKTSQANRFRECPAVKGIHNVGNAFSDYCVCLGIESDLCALRNLFYANRDLHEMLWPVGAALRGRPSIDIERGF